MDNKSPLDVDNNGHEQTEKEVKEAFDGARINLKDLEKEDGILAKMATQQNRGAQSVLQRAMSSVDDEHYRDIGLRAFDDPVKARLTAFAINELDYFGLPIKPLVDMMTFESSSIIGGFMNWIRENLTHSDYTVNYTGKNKNRFGNWWDKEKSGISQQDGQ